MNQFSWYAALIKPTWSPPAWLFGPVWSVLYVGIAVSFGYVFYKTYTGDIPYAIAAVFALNLLANLLFSPIQFGLQSNFFAALDITLVLGTLIAALVLIYPYAPWVTYLNLPYLAWVMFATVLQFNITYLNW
jgi:tryptophan-rich sensory protein